MWYTGCDIAVYKVQKYSIYVLRVMFLLYFKDNQLNNLNISIRPDLCHLRCNSTGGLNNSRCILESTLLRFVGCYLCS